MLYAESIGPRLAIGWTMGTLVSALGVYLSLKIDLPTGATIVCTFAFILILMATARILFGGQRASVRPFSSDSGRCPFVASHCAGGNWRGASAHCRLLFFTNRGVFPVLLKAAGVLCLFVIPLGAQNVPVQEFILDNGMRVLLMPRKGDPNIAAGWVAHVGSVNERPGITGISHLFEHMMFKGTQTIGTKDIEANLKLIDEMDRGAGRYSQRSRRR